MNIIPIPTLLVLQLFPFLLTLVALYFIIFKPMLKYLEERDENIKGAQLKAKELEQQSKEKLDELNNRLKTIRGELNDKRMSVRSELMKSYNNTIYQARQEADKEIKEQVALLAKEQDAEVASLLFLFTSIEAVWGQRV